MNPALQGLITIIIGVGGCVGYFFFSNVVLDSVLSAARADARAATSPWRTASGRGCSWSRR